MAPSIILTAVLATAAALAVVLAFRRIPSTPACPECRAPTAPLQEGFGWDRVLPLRRRWCSACGWEGWRRRSALEGSALEDEGFRWAPGDSGGGPEGFRWRRAPTDLAELPFHWKGQPHPDDQEDGFVGRGKERVREAVELYREPPAPPAHPSGFRWAGRRKRGGHFLWGGKDAPSPYEGSPPSREELIDETFRWKESDDAGFRWKERRRE